MCSGDLMPCTLTLPLISLALTAPTSASVRPTAIAAFAAILDRLITFLSFSDIFLPFDPCVSKLGLEDVVDARLERIGAEEECAPADGIGVRMSEGILIFANDFDVGTHQHLETRAKAIAGVILRGGRAVDEVGMGVHRVVVEGSDQPRIEPVIGACEAAGEFDCRRGGNRGQWSKSEQVVVVMTKHSQSK